MPNWLLTLVCFLVGLGCWGGLGYVVWYYVPDTSTIAFGLFLAFVAITGNVMPPVHFLNRRFNAQMPEEQSPLAERWSVLRQSGLVGAFAVLCLWFQLLRVLNWMIVLLLVGVFVLIEVFFRTRGGE